jgi:SPP1 gp7 family putative phage head morphogenesis protein
MNTAELEARAFATAQRILFRRQLGLARRRRRVPRAQPPRLIESDYAKKLVAILHEQRKLLEPVLAELPQMLASAARDRGDGWRQDVGEGRRARMLLDRVRDGSKAAVRRVEQIAEAVARQVGEHGKRELNRQTIAALGVEVPIADAKLPALVEQFAAENASLLQSLADRTIDDVEKAVTRAIASGGRYEDVGDEIAERYGMAERHARLIARDQIAKVNGQIAAVRHRDLGITSFVWQTSRDERVRPEHEALDGQVFRYDDPPDEGLPGTPILCRCTAAPHFESILDELDDLLDE